MSTSRTRQAEGSPQPSLQSGHLSLTEEVIIARQLITSKFFISPKIACNIHHIVYDTKDTQYATAEEAAFLSSAQPYFKLAKFGVIAATY